jgi:methyl-accepting chemotaxis protein
MRFKLASVRRFELAGLLRTDKNDEQADEANIAKEMEALAGADKLYQPMISSPEERKLYESYCVPRDKYFEIQKRVLQLSRDGKKSEASDLAFGAGRDTFNAASEARTTKSGRPSRR